MNRYVVSGAVLGLLLTLVGIPAPAPASPSGPDEPGTIRVHREYGDGPVQFHGGKVNRVLITFHGQKGDLLEPALRDSDLCFTVSLRGRSGTVKPWSDRLWRLPAGGRFTFDYRLSCSGLQWNWAQLVKVNLHPLPINNGSAVMLGSRKHGAYINAGVVTVPKTGRVQLRPPLTGYDPEWGEGPWSGLYMRGAQRLDLLFWDQDRSITAVYLEAGSPIANEQGGMGTGVREQVLVPRAGQRVILIPNGNHRVRATRARTVPGTLDGAAVPVSADRRWQEVGVRFVSDGDQWVTATVSGPLGARSLRSLAMVGPDGRTLIGLGQATRSPENLWHLPTAGRYRLMVRTDPTHSAGQIALTTVREMDAELPTDGQPVTFTAQKPGDWVLATGHLADEFYTLKAETDVADWHVLANSEPFVLCRSSFCDSGTSAHLDPPSPTQSPYLRDEGPWIFLVAFGPGQSGTISLRLTPTGSTPGT